MSIGKPLPLPTLEFHLKLHTTCNSTIIIIIVIKQTKVFHTLLAEYQIPDENLSISCISKSVYNSLLCLSRI